MGLLAPEGGVLAVGVIVPVGVNGSAGGSANLGTVKAATGGETEGSGILGMGNE